MDPLSLLVALSASSAFAAAPPRPLPELEARGIHVSDGLCGLRPRSSALLVPSVEPDPRADEGWRKDAQVEVQRARYALLRTRRSLDRIQDGLDRVITVTNVCDQDMWDRLEVLLSTAEAAVRDDHEPELSIYAKGGSERWQSVSIGTIEAMPPPTASSDALRYAGVCRAPEIDAGLYSPDAPELSSSARAKLALIADTAAQVSAALGEQKKAFDELLSLTGGRRCRELLTAFDHLIDYERHAFFDYREKAVAGAVWSGLKWRKVAPR